LLPEIHENNHRRFRAFAVSGEGRKLKTHSRILYGDPDALFIAIQDNAMQPSASL
jgi:hypothetical protein